MADTRIVLLADTPNLYRSAFEKYGPATQVDYETFRAAAAQLGSVRSEAVVNDGVPRWFATWLKGRGYAVTYSHAQDCDEMLISRAVLLHDEAECFVIASGDGKNIKLVKLLKIARKRVVVAGIPGSIHRGLVAVADAVIDFPVRRPDPPALRALARAA
jgi:hypothetical protein